MIIMPTCDLLIPNCLAVAKQGSSSLPSFLRLDCRTKREGEGWRWGGYIYRERDGRKEGGREGEGEREREGGKGQMVSN